MSRVIQLNKPAPDFILYDFHEVPIQLSSLKGKKNVILVFNRGFT